MKKLLTIIMAAVGVTAPALADFEPVNCIPGFWQLKGSGEDYTIGEGSWVADGAWAAATSDYHPWTAIGPNGEIGSFAWSYGGSAWGFETYMYFEAGKTYRFGESIDDAFALYIDGERVFYGGGTWGYQGLTLQPNGVYDVSYETSGWHNLRMYLIDGGGGFGACTGFIGAGISEDGGQTWRFLANDPDVRFIVPRQNVAVVKAAKMVEGVANVVVKFDQSAIGGVVKAYSSVDGEAWDAIDIVGTLGDTTLFNYAIAVPDGATQLRLEVEKSPITYRTEIAVADIASGVSGGDDVVVFGEGVTADTESGVCTVSATSAGFAGITTSMTVVKRITTGGGTTVYPLGVFEDGDAFEITPADGESWELAFAPYTEDVAKVTLTSDDVEISGTGKVETDTYGPYKVYKFLDTADGAYTVRFKRGGKADILLVGGGGGGGMTAGGGGGGGGFVYRKGRYFQPESYALKVAAGGRGAYAETNLSDVNGGESSFADLIAYGGGGGTILGAGTSYDGATGGGGGTGYSLPLGQRQGTMGGRAIHGDQGYRGGDNWGVAAGGGGGAGGLGGEPTPRAWGQIANKAGNGGPGRACSITGEVVYYGGGGGGGAGVISIVDGNAICQGALDGGDGGIGGGAHGGYLGVREQAPSGTGGLGGGGGGGPWGNGVDTGHAHGGNGGSGVVIIRVLNAEADINPPAGVIADVVDIAESTATINWIVTYFGLDADSGDVKVAYGRTANEFADEKYVGLLEGESFGSATITGLTPNANYWCQLYVDNGNGDGYVAVGERKTFTAKSDAVVGGISTPGFLQGDIVKNGTVYSDLDVASMEVVGTVSSTAVTYDGGKGWTINCNGEEVAYSLGEWHTIGYIGEMYFDGSTYQFCGAFDDGAFIYVNGSAVVSAGASPVEGSWTPPNGAGWYPIKLVFYNGPGGGGPTNGGFPLGAGWRKSGETDWRKFEDPGDCSLFRYFTKVDALSVGTITKTGDKLTIPAGFTAVVAGSEVFVGFKDDYSGDWAWTKLDDIGTDEASRNIVVDIPDDAKYVTVRVVNDEIASEWLGNSFAIAEAPVIEASKPNATYVSMGAVGTVSAVFNASVVSCGGSCETCDLVVSYGFNKDALTQTYIMEGCEVGSVAVTIPGLIPSRMYYASFHAVNEFDSSSSETEVFSFSTGNAPSSGYSTPGSAGCSLPGLWQAFKADNTDVEIVTNHLSCVNTLGTFAADSYFNGRSCPEWQGTTLDGKVQTYGWNDYYHFAYSGYVYLYDVDYQIYGEVDDTTRLMIGGELLFDSGRSGAVSFSPRQKGWWKGEGWYTFDVWFRNGIGGAGPWNEKIGLAWNTNNYTTVDASANWNKFIDPGDGSFLRTLPGARDGKIESYAVVDGRLEAELSFGIWQASDEVALMVVYGMEPGGDLTNGWDVVESVTVLGRDDDGYSFTGIDGAGTEFNYARFLTIAENGDWQWLGGSLYLPSASRPAFSNLFTLNGSVGDSIILRSAVAAAGLGNAATLTVLVSDAETMADAVVWDYTDLAGGDAIEVKLHDDDPASLKYIAPGKTYYVKAILTDAAGNTDETQVKSVKTATIGGIDNLVRRSTRFNMTLNGNVVSVGAGGEVTVYLYTGDSADVNTMTNTASFVTNREGVPFSFNIDFPFVGKTIYYSFLVSNACESVALTEWYGAGSQYLEDSFTYRWKPSVHSGAWNDKNNWTSDDGGFRATFPNDGNCIVHISTDDADTPVEISVPGYYLMSQLFFDTSDMKVDFTGTTYVNNASRLEVYGNFDTGHIATGVDLCFKDMYLYAGAGIRCPEGMSITFDNAYCWSASDTTIFSDDVTFAIRNGTTYEQNPGHFKTNGDGIRVIVDDSKLWIPGNYFDLSCNSNAGETTLEFFGSKAGIEASYDTICSGADEELSVMPEVIFHLPAEGYEQPPIRSFAGKFSEHSKSPFRIRIAADSPAKSAGKSFSMQLLGLYGGSTGINTDAVVFATSPSSFTLRYDDDANPQSVWVDYKQVGFMILVK